MASFVYFEDDELSGQIMSIILNFQMGYTDLTIWNDSGDFLNRLTSLAQLPDVIFVDIHIRPIDGFGILRGIRTTPSLAAAKVVAVTAGLTGEEIDLLCEAGFDSMVGKPLDIRTFPDLLLRIMNGERVWQPA